MGMEYLPNSRTGRDGTSEIQSSLSQEEEGGNGEGR